MCNKSIRDYNSLVFHTVAFFISGVHKVLIYTQMARGLYGTVDETDYSVAGGSKLLECITILPESLGMYQSTGIPVKKATPALVNEHGSFTDNFRNCRLQACVLVNQGPLSGLCKCAHRSARLSREVAQ